MWGALNLHISVAAVNTSGMSGQDAEGLRRGAYPAFSWPRSRALVDGVARPDLGSSRGRGVNIDFVRV